MIDKPAWLAGGRLCPPDTLNYSTDRANLGHARGPAYAEAMAEIYAACHAVLRPGGRLVVVTKNTRRKGRTLDLAGLTVALATRAGFSYLGHVIALHAAIRDGDLAARPSYWQATQLRHARERGEPAHLVAHEDVTVVHPHHDHPRRPPMPTDLPLSVWPTAQRNARAQRAGRYVEISGHHPAKMLPAIAARAIATYTKPGDLVLDPMAGIGSTLVEAVHLGRDAIGVEYEPQWAELARANLAYARAQGATGHGEVVCGDARHVTTVVDPAVRGLVALVLTSPPYGPSLHGQVTARPGQGIAKSHDRYSTDPANLAHVGLAGLLDAMRTILAGCACLLRPGGYRGHDRPAVVARRPAHRPARRPGPSRRGGRPRPLRTQRGPPGRAARRPPGAPHLVLRPRTGPQGSSCRHPSTGHRPRGLSRLPATA